MNKILPQGEDNSEAKLNAYIEDVKKLEKESESESSESEVDIKPRKRDKKMKVFNPVDPEQASMINKLRRWRSSFAFFELVGKPISAALKAKLDKILTENSKKLVPLETLRDVELELQQAVGSGMDSPPAQADFILKTVNPSLENTIVSLGYDISGFSVLASTYCKEPLVLTLIEHDLLSGRKPSPLLMLTVSYLGAMQFAYYNNKIKAAQEAAKPKPEEAETNFNNLPDIIY